MEENKKELKIAPPWIQYVNKLIALFGVDPEVKIEYDNDEPSVKLLVTHPRIADALTQLLPAEKEFGNVTLKIAVVPANLGSGRASLFKDAFEGSPALNDIQTVTGAFSNPVTYMIFDKKVVQYYNDDLGDLYGNRSTLYEELAKEIFDDTEGVFFCTDVIEKPVAVQKPRTLTVFDRVFDGEGKNND